MKKKLLPILLASLALLPQASRADSKQMFASLVFTSSRSVDDVQLYMPTEGQRGPVVKFGEKRLYVGKRGFALNGLKGLSFHMEVVSGVRDIHTDETSEASKPFAVYSLDGRLVRRGATSLEGLPKGIYIAKGKKYVVK
ncbi:MAG TPA: hypothetical protein DD401_08290 [Prevotella sp.]|nr:hypothetical protein [Prevotella sp.]